MISITMVDKYLGYLTSRFNIPNDYFLLCYNLFKRTYIPRLKDDNNRIGDALNLRSDFIEWYQDEKNDIIPAEEYGNFEEEGANCLEVLLYLSLRLEEDLMYDYKEGDRTIEWFFEFINNLNLDDMTNDNFKVDSEDYISEALTKWIDGTYDADGRNGNIIITNRGGDLRNMSLWAQLQEFAKEYIP